MNLNCLQRVSFLVAVGDGAPSPLPILVDGLQALVHRGYAASHERFCLLPLLAAGRQYVGLQRSIIIAACLSHALRSLSQRQ